jgi:serine/threonine-protein kinase RsbW
MYKETMLDIILAVDEAATNIIIHDYKEETGLINIEVRTEPNTLIICLQDQAIPFDPTRVPAPNLTLPLEKRPLGNMGVHLIHSCVDDMIYEKTPEGGNQLTLKKNISNSKPEKEKKWP